MTGLKDKLKNSKPDVNTNPSMPEAVRRDMPKKLTWAMVNGLFRVSVFEMEAYSGLVAEVQLNFGRSSHERD